jgi:hypothetical protein
VKGKRNTRRIEYAHPKDLGSVQQGEWMMFRNFTFNDIERLGEVMLAVVALMIPVLAITLFLSN